MFEMADSAFLHFSVQNSACLHKPICGFDIKEDQSLIDIIGNICVDANIYRYTVTAIDGVIVILKGSLT